MTHFPAWALAAAAVIAAQPATAQTLTAAQVVEKNAAARGGVEAWRKIQTMAWSGRVESASGGGRRMPFLLEQKRPDRTRFELTADGQKTVRVFDGTNGWTMRASAAGRPGVLPYSADELKFARGAPVIDGPLMQYAARGATIALAGVHEVEGRKAYAVDLRLASGSSYRVWIDAETFLELRYDRQFANAQGRSAVTSVYFADYRAVDGLQVPFRIETGTADGRARDKLVIEQVALNPPLDDRRFAKPGSPMVRRTGVTVDTRSAANPARPTH
jgi:outer membrane lipoprotein-sorting protein